MDKPGPIPGAIPGATLPKAFGEGYDAYVTVRCIANGLIASSKPSQPQQLINGDPLKWVWRLKPADDAVGTVSFEFEMDVTWKPKKPGLPDIEVPKVWHHLTTGIPIGPPLLVKVADKGFPALLSGGVLALGAGVMPKKKRRDEEELEEVASRDEEIEDQVSSTVYAPTEALPGDSFLVQVFAHLEEQAASLDEIAREADEEAKRRITTPLRKEIKRGAELTFHLTMPGFEIDEPSQTCAWEGEPAWVQFGVTIPADHKPGSIIGTVIVSENSIPIGHLKFKFKVVTAVTPEDTSPGNQPFAAAGNLLRYKQAFISYASKDRQEVLKRVQMLNLVKVKFFQDLLTLEPGDSWEKLLYQYIDQSDVFFLFWSKAASESEWVKREIIYAIKRKGSDEEAAPEIVPVIIEGPPPAKPPDDLNYLHFNDKFIYFINTKETAD